MANFLIPDNTITAKIGGETITIKQKIIPDNARATKNICSYIKTGQPVKPCAKLGGDGKPRGICVHNTDNISVANGTNPAEQYSRATHPNGNMGGVVVHFYVWKSEIWQLLYETERGWHAADGSTRRSSHRAGQQIGGNLDTIAIEVIETGEDKETETTAAKLIAYLLNKHGLSPETDVYTHNYFYSAKKCPVYILPHWTAFEWQYKKYFNDIKTASAPPKTTTTTTSAEKKKLYRVQVGAFSVKANAEAYLAKIKAAGFTDAFIKSE
jgi:N-acetylmuramoyl-L-alanine amidase CwlA